jgi:hypothetical protein
MKVGRNIPGKPLAKISPQVALRQESLLLLESSLGHTGSNGHFRRWVVGSLLDIPFYPGPLAKIS